MAEITASAVGKLREMTNAGLMACKSALTEANGDMNAAVDILRKKGQASAEKKAGRDAKDGVIASYIAPGARLGVIVEINCETDFVARNESFRAFCDDIAKKLAGAIARRPVLNEKDWRDLVLAATESAVLELADGNGYLVPAREFQSRGRTR